MALNVDFPVEKCVSYCEYENIYNLLKIFRYYYCCGSHWTFLSLFHYYRLSIILLWFFPSLPRSSYFSPANCFVSIGNPNNTFQSRLLSYSDSFDMVLSMKLPVEYFLLIIFIFTVPNQE